MASDPVDVAATAADGARQRVSATINEIQDRLDPRRIVGDALARIQTTSRVLASQAGDAAKAHPLGIAAAFAALGLALLARNRLANVTVNLDDEAANYTDYDDDYTDTATVPPTAAPTRLPAVAAQTSDAGQASLGVSILAGLVAGAALGAIFPVSDAERRTLGETGNRLSAAARAAARRAGDELDAAGLSVERVRAMASGATSKAKTAARSVAEAARAELKR